MADRPPFDEQAAHRHYSAACFNAAWDLLDQTSRTPEEDETMLRLSLASHWHWTQRTDFGPTQASTAYWQTSHICAVLGRAAEAARYGRLSLAAAGSPGVEPYYLAYAHEALARAAALAGDNAALSKHLAAALRLAEDLDDELRDPVLADLKTIRP